MAEPTNYSNNSQTVVIDANVFDFEPVEVTNGHATVVRFKLNNPNARAGDVLLVLSGPNPLPRHDRGRQRRRHGHRHRSARLAAARDGPVRRVGARTMKR